MHTLWDVSYFAQLYSHIYYAKQQPVLLVTCLSSCNNSSWALSPDRFKMCSFSFYYGKILLSVRTWAFNDRAAFCEQWSCLPPFPWGSRSPEKCGMHTVPGIQSDVLAGWILEGTLQSRRTRLYSKQALILSIVAWITVLWMLIIRQNSSGPDSTGANPT